MGYKLLFVDDEPDLRELICQKFRKQIRHGEYQIYFALNGIEALEIISEHPDLDLVITDINMPGMNGLTLLTKIKELKPDFKTIVISGGGMQNMRKAMNAGAFDLLIKPINLQDLEKIVKKTLEFVQQTKDNQQKLQQVQEQLIQNEKMSSLGKLIAEVAHEINNPLGNISTNLIYAAEYIKDIFEIFNLYQEQFPYPGNKIAEKMEEIDLDYLMEDLPKLLLSMQHGTEIIRDISDSLTNFARGDTSTKIAFDIHQSIDNTLLILKHRLKVNKHRPGIEVAQYYGDLPLFVGYPGKISQVFMNLLSNAIDALEETNQNRSFLQIKTNPNCITIKTYLREDNKSIIIRIGDNGIGITKENLDKIFDNLFTTKPIGKGTGLGLSISHQIITEKHGGKLWCESVLGKGTEFIIELPCASSC
ncbi:MAG: ATP-binding protein [Nostocales cyanobacterium 94392]|nr:ATP-binding protein [Nostocales cyanobacterium 94392]